MLHKTKVLLDQAVALETTGDWKSVVTICEEAFRRSIEELDIVHLTEAVLRAGNAHLRSGEEESATEHLELAVELAIRNRLYGYAARALNSLAIVHQEHGEIAEAESTYLRARNLALASDDSVIAGSIDQNLGTLANIRGDLVRALNHYESSLQFYEQIKHSRGVSGVLNNLGMLYIDLSRLDDARICLERALHVCTSTGDLNTEVVVRINRTELFIAEGRLDLARASCDEAFELTSRIGDNTCRSEALKFYGIIYRESTKPHLAEVHLQQAVAIAAEYNYPLQEAEAQRELALVLRQQDRNREALAALNRSHQLFKLLNAQHEQVEITRRVRQLEEDFLSLVQVWGDSIEAKDQYTRGHCLRVADYACRIAELVGYPRGEMIWFRMGAFLHDIGKTDIPEEILNKPGRLTDDERQIMEQHTTIGAEMLAPIPFPWDIIPMIRSHHERWDGRGYPDQLCGTQIPLTARILRLADVFDALTTSRSYRRSLSPHEAFAIMEADTGAFDPALFEVFRETFPTFCDLFELVEQTTSLRTADAQRES